MMAPQGNICENNISLPPGVDEDDVSALLTAGCGALMCCRRSLDKHVNVVNRFRYSKLDVLASVTKSWKR